MQRHLYRSLAVLFFLASIMQMSGGEPVGIVPCKDVPIRVEIVDTLPQMVRWNLPYRVTHYVRNTSERALTLYFLSRRIEYKWEDTGSSSEDMIAPQNTPGSEPSVYLYPSQSFISSVEGSFGNRDFDGKVRDEGAFIFAFFGMSTHRVPHTIQIRFVYSFALDPMGGIESQHSVATGWKILHVEAPSHALPSSTTHVHPAMSRH